MSKKFENVEDYCHQGVLPHIEVNNNHTMTLQQFLGVLTRIRSSIISRTPLGYVDSNTIGDKFTNCSWGMCSDMAEHYPLPELHIWPKDFVEQGRVAPIEAPEGHHCPMRETSPEDSEDVQMSGCFWQCRVFQRKKHTPSREEAIQLYNEKIAQVEALLKEQENDSGTVDPIAVDRR